MKNLTPSLPPLKSVRLLDQLRERIRYLHYTISTERTYVHWVKAFIRFHRLRHPSTIGRAEIEAFLSWLANERSVAVSTHKQALSALLFLYKQVLGIDLPWMNEIGRPRTTRRLPVVLSPDEVKRLFVLMEGEHRLFAQLLYGTGMRLTEGLRLRVKDVDFEHLTLIVREGKGRKDRALMLPQSLVSPLRDQMARARVLWDEDRRSGRASRCPMHSPASIRVRMRRGRGSGCFRRPNTRSTRVLVWSAAIICTTRHSSVPFSARVGGRACTSPPRLIR